MIYLMARFPSDQIHHVVRAEIPGPAWILLAFGVAMALVIGARRLGR